jgi:hypothetical protein
MPFGVTWLSTEASDLNLFVEQFRALGSANYFFSLSSEVFDSWRSLDLLRVESIQSLVQYFFGWLTTPLLGSSGALNLYLFVGITSSGLVTFILMKKLGAVTPIAVLSGLTIESLPWLRQNILFGTACVFLSVPIALTLILIQTPMNSLSPRDIFRIGSYFVFTALFYSYWFFFGQFIFIVWLFASQNQVRRSFLRLDRKNRVLVVLVIGAALSLYVYVLRVLLEQTISEFGTPFGVYPVDQVLTNINTFRGLITPDAFHLKWPASTWTETGDDQNYMGIFIAAFAALRLVRLVKTKDLKNERRIAVVALACFALAMGRFRIFDIEIPSLREYMRYVMPGIRQFSRLGLIAQALFVVLAWREIEEQLRAFSGRLPKNIALAAIALLVFVDLNPASRRFVYEPPLIYQEVNDVLRNQQDPLLLVSQNSEPAGGFFESSIVRNRIDLYSSLSDGLAGFSSELVSRGVTHILANVDENDQSFITAFVQDSIRFNLRLPPTMYEKVGEDVRVRERDYYGGPVVRDHLVRLVRVKESSAIAKCSDCPKLAQFVSTPRLEVVDPTTSRALNLIDWSLSNQVTFRAESLPGHESGSLDLRFFMRLQLVAGPSLTGVAPSLRIREAKGSRVIRLETSPMWVDLEFDHESGATISYEAECAIAKSENGRWGSLEGRNICFGIADFVVYSSN